MKNIKKTSLLALIGLATVLGSCSAGAFTQREAQAADNQETETPTANEENTFTRPEYDGDERIKTALDSLRGQTHTAQMHYLVAVEYPGTSGAIGEPIGPAIENNIDYTYGYLADGTRATAVGGETIVADWDSGSSSIYEGSETVTTTPTTVYWRDGENGLAETQTRTIANDVKYSYAADYDESTGDITPIIFDSEFRNPWDYIDYDDLYFAPNASGIEELHLSQRKADFFAQTYDVTGANTISDAIVTLDDQGRISGLNLIIEALSQDNFRRINEFSFTYDHDVDTAEYFTEKTPYDNDRNPELASYFSAFNSAVQDEKNYVYTKVVDTSSETSVLTRPHQGVTGYFTKDKVYFSQWGYNDNEMDGQEPPAEDNEDWKDHFYTGTDNYDYAAIRGNNGIYTGYEYTIGGNEWGWGPITVSSSAYYTLNSYAEIGPTFFQINPAIFNYVDENEELGAHYTVDDDLLASIGSYFDFQFLGVHSSAMESSTKTFDLYLKGTVMTVKCSFTVLDTNNSVVFTFDSASIGQDRMPDWAIAGLPN